MAMANSSTTHLGLAGLTCGSCTSSTTKVLTALPGVVSVDVELTAAVVIHDTALVSAQRLVETIEDAGFEAWLGTTPCPLVVWSAVAVQRLLRVGGCCGSAVTLSGCAVAGRWMVFCGCRWRYHSRCVEPLGLPGLFGVSFCMDATPSFVIATPSGLCWRD